MALTLNPFHVVLFLLVCAKQGASLPQIKVKPTPNTVMESNEVVSFTIERNETVGTLQYRFNISGTAKDTVDYTNVKANNFEDGNDTTTVDVKLIDNHIVGSKDIIINLMANPPVYSIDPTADSHSVRIQDNDASFSCNGSSVKESSGTAEVVVNRTGSKDFDVNIRCFTKDDTAKQNTDYTPKQSLLSFGNGDTTKTFQINLANDDITVETNKTFYVTCFSSSVNVLNRVIVEASCNNTLVNIINDDSDITFCNSQATSVDENAGSFVVQLCRTGALSSSVTFNLAITGEVNTFSPSIIDKRVDLNFGVDEDKITHNVDVKDDQKGEIETSSFKVTLSSISSSLNTSFNGQATLEKTFSLIDDDIEFYFPSPRTKTVNEDSGELNVTIKRDGKISVPAKVKIKFNSTLDCNGTNDPIWDFIANQTTREVTLCTIVDDKLTESDEVITATLAGEEGSVVRSTFGSDTMEVTIEDNDVNITCPAEVSVKEDDGNAIMEIKRTGSASALAYTNDISCQTTDGSAVSPSDYTAKTETVSFAKDITTVNFSIKVSEDITVEGNETLSVTCATTDPKVNLYSCTNVPITIINDDSYVFFCHAHKTYIREASGPYTVSLCRVGVMSESRTVKLCWTSDGNGKPRDIPSVNQSCTDVVFSPYETRKDTNIMVVDDVYGEDEYKNVMITVSSTDDLTFNGTKNINITLHDDDNTFCVVGSSYKVYEQTDQYANFTIKRWGAITSSNASVRIKIVSNAATSPQDYQAPFADKVFQFLVNETEKTVTIKINNDKETEDSETFHFKLEGVNGSTIFQDCKDTPLDVISNDVNILCDSLNIGKQEVFENKSPVMISFERQGALQYNHTIRIYTKNGTAKSNLDLLPFDKVLTFGPSQTLIHQNVTFINDLIVEPDESFQVIVTSSDNRVNIMCPGIDYVIKNDDTMILCANSSLSISEGTKTVYFVLKRDGYIGRNATIWYDIVDGTAYAKADYQPINKTYVTFKVGQEYMTLSADIVNDDVKEDTEDFSIVIGTDDPTIVTPSSCTTMTVNDDDEERITEKEAQELKEQRRQAVILLACAAGVLAVLVIVVVIAICILCRVVL